MTSSHQRSLLAASVRRKSAQPSSSFACLTPYALQVLKPQGFPTACAILPGRLVLSCPVVSGGRGTGSVVIGK
jgi:hypothetical protein